MKKSGMTQALRDKLICERAARNEPFTAIAADWGITRERVRQIVLRDSGRTGRDRFDQQIAARKNARKAALAERREARRLAKVQRIRDQVETRAQGMSLEAIGNLFGLTVSAVHSNMQWAQRQPEFSAILAQAKRVSYGPPRPILDGDVRQITKLRHAGWSQTDIARAVGRAQCVVSLVLRREGA